MKRDMDLIRGLLLQLEDRQRFEMTHIAVFVGELETERSREEIEYHIAILIDAGLVDGEFMSDDDSRVGPGFLGRRPGTCVARLTWAGHEFLDAARDDTRWNKAKAWLVEQTGGIVFSLLRKALLQQLHEQLGMSTE